MAGMLRLGDFSAMGSRFIMVQGSLVIGLPREIPDRDSVAYFTGIIGH